MITSHHITALAPRRPKSNPCSPPQPKPDRIVVRRCVCLPITARGVAPLGDAYGERGPAMTTTVDTPARGRPGGEEVARLVRSVAAGDQRGWDALVDEFGSMIWAVARAHRLGDADAADVAQATWLRLFEHLKELREPGRVGAWLATTARRECLRILRGAHRHVPFDEATPEHESLEAPAPEALLIAERDQALWHSFQRLRATDRALLRMLMADPRPAYEEISAALDMPVGSIGPTRARALERLRQQLASDGALTLLSA